MQKHLIAQAIKKKDQVVVANFVEGEPTPALAAPVRLVEGGRVRVKSGDDFRNVDCDLIFPMVMTSGQVAELLQTTTTTVNRWCDSGKLPFTLGWKHRPRWKSISFEDLQNALQNDEIPPDKGRPIEIEGLSLIAEILEISESYVYSLVRRGALSNPPTESELQTFMQRKRRWRNRNDN